jgi:glycine/serine hydroxymethyltransferase
MQIIAEFIHQVVENIHNTEKLAAIKVQVIEFISKFNK